MTQVCKKPPSLAYTKLRDTVTAYCNITAGEFRENFDEETGLYRKDLYCSDKNMTDANLLSFLILKEVRGNVYLDNNQLTHVDGLVNLTSIGGNLHLNANSINNLLGLSQF